MTPHQWAEINRLFHAALAYEPAERNLFLASECGEDESMRLEVQSLLASHAEAVTFIESPAADLAAQFLADDEIRPVPGQIVGSFRIAEVIAAGGMGEVYLAYDNRLGRKVALKFLPHHFTADRNRVRRFEQEARAASALNHPNIITILEIGQTESFHFIATEFVDGETLRKHFTNERMTVGEILDVAIQIGSALQAAHEAGIVHRDIKPENIMLRRDGVAKVLDFGLAKLTAQDGDKASLQQGEDAETLIAASPLRPISASSVTDPGVIMGTVGYMSPEQARGQTVDARTDIWSFGVVLYEMVSGVAPFSGETPSHVIVSILENEPAAPSSFDPQVPSELEAIALKALTKDISQRFQTAREMTLQLKNLKGELDVDERLMRRVKPRSNGSGEAASRDSYSLNATTLELPADTAENAARPTIKVKKSVSNALRLKTWVLATLAVLMAVVAGWAYLAFNRNNPEPVAQSTKSIIVLPVKPINEGDRDEIYEIGIADSLIHRLNSIKGLFIRPLTVSQEYRNNTQDPLVAGKEQRVDYVLASTYQLNGGKIRVTVQLINVATGQLEDTYQIESERSDIFAMQDFIAAEVGSQLQAQFSTTATNPGVRHHTNNEDAYRLYLQGMYLANQRTLGDGLKAIETLEQAVRLDPNYARAWAGLGYTHRTISQWTSKVSTQEAYRKSMEAINKALDLDANLSEAHSALCENKFLYEWDFAGAELECRRALQLDPDSSQSHEIYARLLMGRGRHEEALVEIKAAIDLEPTSKFYHKIYARSLFYARQYPEAEAQFIRAMAMDPHFTGMHSWITSTLALQGKEPEAFEWLLKLLAIRNMDERTIRIFKEAYQGSGWRGALREWIKRIDTVGGNTFDLVIYHAQIGDKDRAFEYLQKVYENREIWMTYLEVDPRLDALRSDPRFAEMLKRVAAH